MRPAIYGYMRIASRTSDSEEIERIRRELSEYADREGFSLGDVFTEDATHSESGFSAMLDALKKSEVRDIIVPSLWHFARLPGLQEAMKRHVEHETGARIWVVLGERR